MMLEMLALFLIQYTSSATRLHVTSCIRILLLLGKTISCCSPYLCLAKFLMQRIVLPAKSQQQVGQRLTINCGSLTSHHLTSHKKDAWLESFFFTFFRIVMFFILFFSSPWCPISHFLPTSRSSVPSLLIPTNYYADYVEWINSYYSF